MPYFAYSPVGSLFGSNVSYVRVFNGDSVTLTRGTPVYTFGAQGDTVSVKRALNTSDATSARTIGLVWEPIAVGEYGYVIENGVIDKVNTGSFNNGDILYLGATAGTITNVKPQAPNHMVYLGVVERANAGNGQILVKVQNGYEIDELHDVKITTPVANNSIIQYNSTTGLWENKPASAGLPSSLQVYSAGTAETFDRIEGIRAARTLTSGVSYFTALTPNENVTASGISIYTTAAAVGLTIARFGLYTFNGTTLTLVARTADVKASLNVNNVSLTFPFDTAGGYPSTYNLSANTLYYVGALEVGTTPATINGPSTPSSVSGMASFINSGTPKLSMSIAGQTDLVASVAMSSLNTSVAMLYARLA